MALRRDEVVGDVVEKGMGSTPRNTLPARAGQSWSLGGAGGWGCGGGQRGGASLTPLRPPHLCPFHHLTGGVGRGGQVLGEEGQHGFGEGGKVCVVGPRWGADGRWGPRWEMGEPVSCVALRREPQAMSEMVTVSRPYIFRKVVSLVAAAENRTWSPNT